MLVLPLADQGQSDLELVPTGFEGALCFYLQHRFSLGQEPFLSVRPGLPPDHQTFLRVYLPLLLGSFNAQREGRLFVTAHLAQTLDGRIACHNGHSQWISNEANLFHAHRLRALHDGVVVGGRTVLSDDPQLTVRHVDGDDPRRVILNASASLLRSDTDYKVFRDHGSLVLCRESACADLNANGHAVDVVPIGSPDGGMLRPDDISSALFERGIRSAFLEGGGRTLSGFLQGGAIDMLHIHVAPVILGSGIQGFSLPEVATVQAGVQMHMEHFSFNGELLFECRNVAGPVEGAEGP